MGAEFLEAYRKVEMERGEFDWPVLSMCGGNDSLVNPLAARRFIGGIKSKDKTLVERKENWHTLLQEPGKEEVFRIMAEWIAKRC